MSGKLVYSMLINEDHKELVVSNTTITSGIYVVNIVSENQMYKGKVKFY